MWWKSKILYDIFDSHVYLTEVEILIARQEVKIANIYTK